MVRLFAILLILASLLAGFGELAGLLLPTLSWPFTAAREMDFLNWGGFSDSLWAPSGSFPWFGWLIVAAAFALGARLLMLPQERLGATPAMQRRWKRFRSIKRGYYSFLTMAFLCLLAALDQSIVGKRALFVEHEGNWYFPAFTRAVIPGTEFGLGGDRAEAEADYRLLKAHAGLPGYPSCVVMPPIPFDPTVDEAPRPVEKLDCREGILYRHGESSPYDGQAVRLYDGDVEKRHLRFRFRRGLKDGTAQGWNRDGEEVYAARYEKGQLVSERYSGGGTVQDFLNQTPEDYALIHYHPAPPPAGGHLFGTNSQGSDILAYLFGGLQVNVKAALFFLPVVYGIGLTIGMLMGYFGGAFDLGVQRLIEILAQIPFLFVIMILSDMVPVQYKGLLLIVALLSLFGWTSMSYLLRTATMKEKQRDYIAAARVMGASTSRILFHHILPNQLAIVVTLIPFSVSAVILSLASLDYLGFGLPDTYASWGRLLNDGLANLSSPWIVTSGFAALAITLLLVTFTGEAVREAFDPRKFTTYK